MSMLKSYSTRIVLATLASCGALAACGDDIHKGGPADARINNTADAPNPDAPPGTPDAPVDAMPTGPTVAGTVAITDVKLVDPAVAAVGGIQGGAFAISFSDLTHNGGQIIFGTPPPVGGCVVTQYDPQHKPNPLANAGPILVSDVKSGNNSGLLKTVGPCTLQAQFGGYTCISNSAAGTGTVNATNPPDSPSVPATVMAYTFPADATVATNKLVGSYLVISGFTTTTAFNNSAAEKAFPIIGQNGATLFVVNQTAGATTTDGTTETVTGTATYAILNAFNPVPSIGAAADYLGTGGVRVTSTGNAVWPAIDKTITNIPGTGFALSDPGDPTAVPLTGTATDIKFGCDNGTPADTTDDTCGSPGAASSALGAMIISGTATKQDVSKLPPFLMPTEDPTKDTWLQFQCGAVGLTSKPPTSVTLSQGALQSIIDFKPTRVELRVINATGFIVSDPSVTGNQTFLLAGHAIVGHTTAP